MLWKLYYGDGATFSSEDGDWLDAPARNVAGLLTPSTDVGTHIHHKDFYVYWSEPWGCDQWGVLDFLLDKDVIAPDQPLSEVSFQVLKQNGVKLGRTYSTPQWRELYKLMKYDPDFPRKSSRYRSERC